MTHQYYGKWMAVIAVGVALGAGTLSRRTPDSTPQVTHDKPEPHYDQQFARLEQEVTALTQAVERSNAPDVRPQPACATTQTDTDNARQSLAKIIREELRQALAQCTPEGQKERAEEIANAQLRDSPENHAAYQSVSAVVRAAVAAKRWTDEDAQDFRATLGRLTKEQHQELMELLLPAINRGEVTVETSGSLF
jgi:hypothetical protein